MLASQTGKWMMPETPNPSGEPADARKNILERLLAAHEAWFDVARDVEFAGRTFPGYAELHSSTEGYVLTKRAKLWGASSHEYLFFAMADRLNREAFDDMASFMTTEALGKVEAGPEHMVSYLSLVIIASSMDDEVRRAVRKTRFRKSFRCGLRGWTDLRIAVIDLSASSVTTNAMGEELRATLEANAFGAL